MPATRLLSLAMSIAILASAAALVRADEPLSAKDLLNLEEKRSRTGYWHASLLGGIVVPTDRMGQAYKEGIAANLRLGYTARSGLGVSMGAAYAPLASRDMTQDNETTHLALLAAAPRFTVGHDFLRAWVGAGGGVAVEREKVSGVSKTTAEPMAMGEAGLEFYVFGGGGLSLQGNYVRSFGGTLDARLFSALGGLVFTF